MTPSIPAPLPRSPDDLARQADAAAGRLRGSVRACLPWTGVSRIPRHYESFAAVHFQRRAAGGHASWADDCPAYALAYLTHAAYRMPLDAGETAELQAQWDELRGTSKLAWPDALKLVQEAWAYLA